MSISMDIRLFCSDNCKSFGKMICAVQWYVPPASFELNIFGENWNMYFFLLVVQVRKATVCNNIKSRLLAPNVFSETFSKLCTEYGSVRMKRKMSISINFASFTDEQLSVHWNGHFCPWHNTQHTTINASIWVFQIGTYKYPNCVRCVSYARSSWIALYCAVLRSIEEYYACVGISRRTKSFAPIRYNWQSLLMNDISSC